MSKKVGILLISFLLIIQFLFVLFLPYAVADKIWMSLSESLRLRYGGMNGPKTATFVFVFLFLASIYYVVYLYFENKYTIVSIVIIYIITSMLFFTYIPQHAAFDLVNYGGVKKPQNKKDDEYISFIGLGDIQLFSDMPERTKYSDYDINTINKFIDTYYTKMDGKNGDIMGVVTPGDCTQTGQDGRLFTHNELGMYETRYGLGGKNSVLKVPVYECNGNHDYDVAYTHKHSYKGKVPSVLMINRKNKYRSIKSQDKKGNYWWNWGELNIIALNVWPSNKNLLYGKPDGSLDFLKNTIPKIPTGEKFMILTHYVPNANGWDQEDFWKSDTLIGTPCEPLLSIIKDRKQDLVGIMIGHIHRNTWRRINADGIQIIILPSPLNSSEFALLRFNKKTKELRVQNIGINWKTNQFYEKDIPLDTEKFYPYGTQETIEESKEKYDKWLQEYNTYLKETNQQIL